MPTLHALLLTDVVDSTRLTEELGDAAMAALWTAHDRVARDLLPAWRGREIDKTDGMLLLFDNVTDAVGYALAYHRALAARELPFKARAGIHVGPISLRPNTADDVARGAKPVEVDGLALPIAARVMSVALGAQTLLSADARLALGVAPQRVVSHGHWRMHGVADPVELFEIGDIGEGSTAPFKAPPDGAKVYRVMRQGELWQPLREVRHSVPAERDSFVGRQEPLQLLAKKFDDGARLVSVLGMGGTGKTRLVTRFAWTVLGDYPGGIWFCDLSQARTVDGIHFAVAQGLDVPLGKTDPVVQLAHAIAGRGKCLVILDNFEQVARFAEETLGRWLDRAPSAQYIVTTREVLGIVGEETLFLEPLPDVDAAELFTLRAESARSGYRPSADDLVATTQLVKILDGLPLAIELAAARVTAMQPRALLDRMHERFSVLRSHSGRRDRQATLRAVFDWSWELLSDPERAALAQLSVFNGGFTLDSAQAVVDLASMTDAPGTVDLVQWLVDRSLVRRVSDERFDLLESTREYASEKLSTDHGAPQDGRTERAAAERRHGSFFAAIEPRRAVEQAGRELDNLVSACRRAVLRAEGELAVQLLSVTWGALKLRGPYRVALELACSVDGMAALPAAAAQRLARVRGHILMTVGQMAEAQVCLSAALAGAHALGQVKDLAISYASLAELAMHQGRMQDASDLYACAVENAQATDDLTIQCDVLSGLGNLHLYRGELEPARARHGQAIALARQAGNRRWEGGALGNMGYALSELGRYAEAREHHAQSLTIALELGDRQWEGSVRCNLGLLDHAQGRMEEASTNLALALDIARELGHARLESVVLCNLGIVQEALGRAADAAQSYESALRLARSLGDRRSEGQFLGYLGILDARQGRQDAAAIGLAQAEGLLRAVSDRASLGIVLCFQAEAAHLAGLFDSAHQKLKDATTLAQDQNAEANSEFGTALGRARGLIELAAPA